MTGNTPPLGFQRLEPTRVPRFYRGGAMLDAFRAGGGSPGNDGDTPEDWVGSVTRAWTPPGEPTRDTGLSWLVVDGHRTRLADLLAERPVELAGEAITSRAGVTTGLLVKLIDAAIRLPVHAHPTRTFARRLLGSQFGKAEAWIVIGVRELPDGEPPHIRVGFREPIGRDELLRLVEREGGARIAERLRVRPVHPGDVWFVPPGLPHAIGAGVFLVEVQEPTDFSIVAETAGFRIDPANAHLGLGWPVMVDAFDRRGWSDHDLERLHRFHPLGEPGHRSLLPPDADPFFRADRYRVEIVTPAGLDEAFTVLVVLNGRGRLTAGQLAVDVHAGDTVGVPAAIAPDVLLWPHERLEVIACRPPRGDLLEAVGVALDARAG